jgi:hypothetical protein
MIVNFPEQVNLCLSAMKAYMGSGGISRLIFKLGHCMGGEWLGSRPFRFTPGDENSTLFDEGVEELRAGQGPFGGRLLATSGK